MEEVSTISVVTFCDCNITETEDLELDEDGNYFCPCGDDNFRWDCIRKAKSLTHTDKTKKVPCHVIERCFKEGSYDSIKYLIQHDLIEKSVYDTYENGLYWVYVHGQNMKELDYFINHGFNPNNGCLFFYALNDDDINLMKYLLIDCKVNPESANSIIPWEQGGYQNNGNILKCSLTWCPQGISLNMLLFIVSCCSRNKPFLCYDDSIRYYFKQFKYLSTLYDLEKQFLCQMKQKNNLDQVFDIVDQYEDTYNNLNTKVKEVVKLE